MNITNTNDAGKLSVRLSLETPQRTADGGGGTTLAWTETTKIWGALRPLGRSERRGNGGKISEVSHDITIRYRSGVLPSMRFVHGARVFNILAVLDDESRQRLVCHCQETVPS